MRTLPSYLIEMLAELAAQGRRAAFVRTDEEGRALECGGALDWYGLALLEPGAELCAACAFLEGLFPMTSERLDLPRLETDKGRFADVHLVRRDGGVLVVLLDASGEVEQQSLLVQKGNDLNLLLGRLGGREITSREWPDVIFGTGQDRIVRTACALSVHLSVTPLEGYSDPSTLAAFERMTSMALLRLREQSAVTQLCGIGRIQAVFGAVPSTGVTARQVLAAVRSLEALASEQRVLLASSGAGWSLAAGAATGTVIIEREARSGVALLGEVLDRAWTLCSSAEGGGALVDAATTAASGLGEERFRIVRGVGDEAIYEYLAT